MNAWRSPPRIVDRHPALPAVRDAALAGLTRTPKQLPPWLFYDAAGSRWFEAICAQPEYYPTRSELEILEQRGSDIAATIGPDCHLIELGSGAARKASCLLRSLRRLRGYVAIDISADALHGAIAQLAREFPALPLTGVVADFADPQPLDTIVARDDRRVAFFPGSTLGNMHPAEAGAFLQGWAGALHGGGMLVGIDLPKSPDLLHAAYNDAAGATAAFNRNLLTRLNRELGADFDLARFEHLAFFDAERSRIEMHLRSVALQGVHLAGRRIAFEDGETIHTENSYKYSLHAFAGLAESAGLHVERCWLDRRGWFALLWLRPQAVRPVDVPRPFSFG